MKMITKAIFLLSLLLGISIITFFILLKHPPQKILLKNTEIYKKKIDLIFKNEIDDNQIKEKYKIFFKHLFTLEDNSFEERNSAYELKTFARIAYYNLKGKRIGGSGIPQLVISLLIDDIENKRIRHTVKYKATQFYLSSYFFSKYDSNKFLSLFIKHYPLPHGLRGLDNASYYLFKKKYSDLKDEFSIAILAAFIKKPVYYSKNTKELYKRARYSLRKNNIKINQEPKLYFDKKLATFISFNGKQPNKEELPIYLALKGAITETTKFFKEKKSVDMEFISGVIIGNKVFLYGRSYYLSKKFNAGSFAKITLLRSLEKLGYHSFIHEKFPIEKLDVFDFNLKKWSPSSVGKVDTEISLIEAVVKSYNGAIINYLYFPFWAFKDYDFLTNKFITKKELKKYSTLKDRIIALETLSRFTNYPYSKFPKEAPNIYYRVMNLIALKAYKAAFKDDFGVDIKNNYVSMLIGGGIDLTIEQYLKGFKNAFFLPNKKLTYTASLIAKNMSLLKGTLHWLMNELNVNLPGKTATSEHNINIALGFNIRYKQKIENAVFIMIGFKNDWSKLPDKIYGSNMSGGIIQFFRKLKEENINFYEVK